MDGWPFQGCLYQVSPRFLWRGRLPVATAFPRPRSLEIHALPHELHSRSHCRERILALPMPGRVLWGNGFLPGSLGDQVAPPTLFAFEMGYPRPHAALVVCADGIIDLEHP